MEAWGGYVSCSGCCSEVVAGPVLHSRPVRCQSPHSQPLCRLPLCVDSTATKNNLSYLKNQCFICFKIQTLTMAKASLCLRLARALQSKCLLAQISVHQKEGTHLGLKCSFYHHHLLLALKM